MAISFNDNRGILNEADAITGYTATDGPVVFNTVAPTPIEAGACLGMQVSNTSENAYFSITSDDWSGGGSLFVWVTDRAAFDTLANGGIGLITGDGTNRIAYHVGGSDATGFRHEEGPVKWTCFQLDLANKPANFTALVGSEASLNEAAITQVGVYFKTIAKSVGGADNCFWDIIRFADNGVGIEIYGGTSGSHENWETATVTDRGVGNQQAHGIIRKVGAGAYSIQGNISIGDATGTAATYIDSDGETFLWEDRGQSTNNYYRFNAVGNTTGVTDINFDSCTWTCPTSGSIDVSDANVDAFDVRNTVITGFDQGILTGGSSNVWTENTFSGCGQLETTGTDLQNCTYTGYTGVANTSQLYWNTTTNPNGKIDGSSFTMPATATHAIEFPTGMTNQSINIVDCDFIGYSASNSANGSTFNVLATTGTLTINISGGTGNRTYRSAGATVVIVVNPVTTLITVRDIQTKALLQNARVRLTVTNGTNFPFEASVTATSSGTTATVTHTAHGLATNDYILIAGANEQRYNGCFQITVTGVNTYTYTMTASTTSPATGTITATFTYFNTLTNASGQVSDTRTIGADQAVTGWVRKATTVGELYQESPIGETIDNINGLTLNINLIPDE